MKFLKHRCEQIVKFYYAVKDKNLDWQTNNQAKFLQLRQEKILAKRLLEAELSKQSVQLAHEIELLKTRHNTELKMLKERCREDIKDYRDYMDALGRLKNTLQHSYAHLPEAITLTIHHHAKSLLNKMWEAENQQEKIGYEAQLLQFMTTVHEEARLIRPNSSEDKLPENTLKLIHQDPNIKPLIDDLI